MARRNRIVVYLPEELVLLIDLCTKSARGVTRTGTICALLETHPRVVEMAEALYDVTDGADRPQSKLRG